MQGFFATAEGCLADTSMVVGGKTMFVKRQIFDTKHKALSVI